QARAQAERRTGRPPDVHLHAGLVERRKKPEPLDVIHVQVGEQQIDAANPAREGGAESPYSRPGIEHQHVVLRAHLDARGVAAVASSFGSRASQRTARAPERDVHHDRTSQKIATAPRWRPAWPSSGNAVTSISRRTLSNPRRNNRPCAGRRSRNAIINGRSSGGTGRSDPSELL